MPDNSETFDLLQRYRAGDPEALDLLLGRDLPWLRELVHRKLGDGLRRAGDTEDFVQEAALHVLRYGPRFVISDREQFRNLLARIVLNVLCSGHRQLHALKRTPQREKAVDPVLVLDGVADSMTSPDQAAARAEERDWLRLGMLLLDPQDQEVLELHMDGRSDPQIGEALGLQTNAARMRRQRATGRLAQVVLRLKKGRIPEAITAAESAPGGEGHIG